MKITKVLGLCASALYAAGICTAVANSHTGQETVIEAVNPLGLPSNSPWDTAPSILPESLQNRSEFEQVDVLPAMSANKPVYTSRITGMYDDQSKVNKTVNKRAKFIEEQDISGENDYFVVLSEPAIPAYQGGVKGYLATNPKAFLQEQEAAAGVKSVLSSNSSVKGNTLKRLLSTSDYKSRVDAYQSYLLSQQDSFVQAARTAGVSITAKLNLTHALNAITASMTQEQARTLSQLSQVQFIERVKTFQPQTVEVNNSGNILKNAPSGNNHIKADEMWAAGFKGEGIIVGVADTGINTDHPSFHDFGGELTYTDDSGVEWTTADPYNFTNPMGQGVYVGDCQKATLSHLCNDKLIGVRSYKSITSVLNQAELIEMAVERGADINVYTGTLGEGRGEDYNGHGSHTAGTSAGNAIANVDYLFRQYKEGPGVVGSKQPLGDASGVAPRANIISYQVCIPSTIWGGCLADAMVQSVEDGMQDGVDVMNFSLGGGPFDPYQSAFALAMLNAREVGMHSIAASGNAGVNNTSYGAPWILSVGASSLGRHEFIENNDDLRSGAKIEAMRDGVEYDLLDIFGYATSISGTVEDDNGEPVLTSIILAANHGACIVGDCSLQPTCELGDELIDGYCYQMCSDEEFRDPVSLECLSLDGPDPERDPETTGCKFGEILENDKCVYDDETINAIESICEGKEYGIYDEQFEEDNNGLNHYACEGVTQAVSQCVSTHIGKSGASAGLCCSYGVYPEVASGIVDRAGEIEDPIAGACCAEGNCNYVSNQTPIAIEEAGDEFTSNSVSSAAATSKETNSASTPVSTSSTGSFAAEPILSRYENDYYCENLENWQTYNEATGEIEDFSFNGKIIMCARGNGGGLNIYEKMYNVAGACDVMPSEDEIEEGVKPSECAAGAILYNDDREYSGNNLYTVAAPIPYMHINNTTWVSKFKPFMEEGENHQIIMPSTYRLIGSDPSMLDHMAGFSSYGPHWYNPNIMSPMVTAPGMNIYAPWSDQAYFGIGSQSSDWTFETGTSMAAPHVTGAMALMVQARPDWSATMRDSAMILTARRAQWGFVSISEAEYDPNNPNHFRSERDNILAYDIVTGKPIRDDNENYESTGFSFYMKRVPTDYNHGGAGIIDVDAASKASLVLDESVENMRNADPAAGADVSQLNVPYLFNAECPAECHFVRTFTATVDGTWQVSTSTGELSVELESSVSEFSLKAGETQTIFFTGRVDRSVSKDTDGGGFVFGEVQIIPQMPNTPEMKLAVGLSLADPAIPAVTVGKANTNIGQFPVTIASDIDADELDARLYRSSNLSYVETVSGSEVSQGRHGIVELANTNAGGTWVGQAKLALNDTYNYSLVSGDDLSKATSVKLLWVDVPEGTKVLTADVLERVFSSHSDEGTPQGSMFNGMMHVIIGRDINSDMLPDFSSEGMCWSGSEAGNNFCHIHDPKPGKYWVFLENVNRVGETFNAGQYDIHNYAISVIPEDSATDMVLSAPSSVDGIYESTWDVVYDVDLNNGDATFAYMEVGSRENESDIGTMVLRLDRASDIVTITPHRSNMAAGGFVYLDIELAANHTGYGRDFEIKVSADEDGLYQYATGTLGGDGRFIQYADVTYDSFVIGGVQPNTYRWAKRYDMTTNLTQEMLPEDVDYQSHPLANTYDPYCRTHINSQYYDGESSNYGYLDIARVPNSWGLVNYGAQYGSESELGMGRWSEKVYMDTQKAFAFAADADFNTLNAPASFTELRFSQLGFVDAGLDAFNGQASINMAGYFGPNFQTWPEIRLAPLHKASLDHQLRVIKKDPENFTDLTKPELYQGMTVTGFSGQYNRLILMEWDNAYTLKGNTFLEGSEGVRADDSYDFQVWIDLEYNNFLGHKEIVYAYDNLDMLDGRGSVGVHGFSDYRARMGPIGGYYNQSALFNNLDEGLVDGLLICFDYVGPEYSETQFNTWVKLTEKSAGQTVDIKVDVSIDGVTQQYIVPIEVSENINAPQTSTITLKQGETKTVPLAYSDLSNTANEVFIESPDVKVTALGTQPGDDLVINATCSNFQGSTQAKIRIQDSKYSTDAAEQILNIEVLPVEGFVPQNCPSEEVANEPQEKASSDSSGGSAGIFLLLMLIALVTGRHLASSNSLRHINK
ncbi:S8 family serine peptidase [Thalassotalea sp. PLHSN55]|uniref:S8 family serine peptidase n=1 Tax=Thalassotalea sp. PLHSN55 TaxID=3435888 RepID=UPI003F870CE4